MKGYFGKFLKVDLTDKKIEDLPISDDDLKKYVGGSTLAAKMIYDYVKPGMDPLAPENPSGLCHRTFYRFQYPHGQPGGDLRNSTGKRPLG